MQILPLKTVNNLYCFTLDNHLCLIDTGSPASFGDFPSLQLDGIPIKIKDNYMALSASRLSGMVGESINALIGADILNNYEIIIDTISNTISFSSEKININDDAIDIEYFMDIPVIQVQINSKEYQMFFDTGSHLSYWQDELLTEFPMLGKETDFYPGYGEFNTNTHNIDITIGKQQYQLKCGMLPGLLGMTLAMANVDGIIGNEIMHGHVIEYSPENGKMVIS